MLKAFIIGGGPSIKDTNLDLVKDRYVIGVNAAFRLGTWVNVCFFGDNRFYQNQISYLEKWPNRIVSCAPKAKNNKKIEYLKRCQKHPLCTERDKIYFPSRGANSGAAAINLAIREGAKEVILLGFDMQTVNGQHNYHKYHNHNPNDKVYDRFIQSFENIAKELKNVKVYNATPGSKLKCFPKVDLNEII